MLYFAKLCSFANFGVTVLAVVLFPPPSCPDSSNSPPFFSSPEHRRSRATTSPDKLVVSRHPRPPQITNGDPVGRQPPVAVALHQRPRLRSCSHTARRCPISRHAAPQPASRQQTNWGQNPNLAEAISQFLTRYGHISTQDNRYITIDGCVRTFCPCGQLVIVRSRFTASADCLHRRQLVADRPHCQR